MSMYRIKFDSLFLPSHSLWMVFLGALLCVGCPDPEERSSEPSLSPVVAAADNTPGGPLNSPEDEVEQEQVIHEPQPEVVIPNGATWDPRTVLGGSNRNYSLKDQVVMGTQLRREVSLSRQYHLQVQDRLTSRAEGGSEWHFVYDVTAEEALGGEILQAMLFIEEDQRRSHSSRERRPSNRLLQGPLSGVQSICNRDSQNGYRCVLEDESELSLERLAVLPQRPELVPRRPVSIGDNWQIEGTLANRLLGLDEGEVSVLFTLQQADLFYRDEPCFRVDYRFSGLAEIPPSQAGVMAGIEGEGEYYYGRESGFLLYHKQTQRLSVEDFQGSENSAPVFFRDEEITLEERIYPIISGAPEPAERPMF